MRTLPAQYLPYAKGKAHGFAIRLAEFAESAERGSVLLLHAPTGAGKTRALFPIAERRQGVLLTVPTNALASEVEEAYARDHPGAVARWNADAFKTKGRDRHETMINEAQGKDLVVSNPDMLHLFTQHWYVPFWARMRLSGFGMRNLGLLVFDEYHAYEERVLAAALLYVLKARSARNNDQRFVFMSATRDDGLRSALDRLHVTYEEAPEETMTTEPLPEHVGRKIKGEIELEVTSDPILTSLPRGPPRGRMLFIFSTFLDQQRAVRVLLDRGFPEADVPAGFVQITGRKTNSNLGQDTWERAGVLLATSKVEVGLNIAELDEVVMEPGRSEQQFWQRFGRGAREGRAARIRLHFEGYPESVLTPLRQATDIEEIDRAIHDLIPRDARHVDSILRFVGAYESSYRENTPVSEDQRLVDPHDFDGPAAQGRGLVASMFATWRGDELYDVKGGSREWMATVRWSLRSLRGQALEVPTSYAWGRDGEIVRENVLYVLTRTDAQRPDGDGVYRVNEFLPKPREATVQYRILRGATVVVPTRGSLDRREFRRLPTAIEAAVRRELDGELPPFWEALTAWLRLVPPDEIPPAGVEPDDLFL